MERADALSRRPDHGVDDEVPTEVTLLPDQLFLRSVSIPTSERLKDLLRTDPIAKAVRTALAKGSPPPLRTALEDWTLDDDLLLCKGRIYVPDDRELRREITSLYHDPTPMGHPGRLKTLELVRRDYYWPGQGVFVHNYVDGCAICQQAKVNTHPTIVPPHPIPALPNALPFTTVSMDFITDLPPSNGYDSLLVVVDHDLTKGVIFCPCNKTIDAIGTAQLLLDNLYRRFGLPTKIISDRGPQFASQVFQQLCKKLGIESALSTAYHPQTDGETERVNQELETYLRIYCADHPDTWTEHLPMAEFAHNNRPHSARNTSPFYLTMGYDPRPIPSVSSTSKVPSVEQRLANLQQIRDEARAAHELARAIMKERRTKGFVKFAKGQKVWLEAKNLRLKLPSRKLAPKREGPFVISDVLGPVTYRLKLPKTWKIHPNFHASLLSPYKENDTHGPNFLSPPPEIIGGEDEYEVEAIINHRDSRNGRRFLIKWKGYPTSANSWEPRSLLTNAADVLAEYERKILKGVIKRQQTRRK